MTNIIKLIFSLFIVPSAQDESGLKTIKQSSETKNLLLSDYHKSLSQRIKEGLTVKNFQNTQRIHLGKADAGERNYRKSKRGQSSKHGGSYKLSPYKDMVKWREEIKENTNKVNCFVDQAQPEFINTMSRTMDAFDMQMSTFGGKHKGSKKNMANFVQEKRGFIRTSNGYTNVDPFKIIEKEYV